MGLEHTEEFRGIAIQPAFLLFHAEKPPQALESYFAILPNSPSSSKTN